MSIRATRMTAAVAAACLALVLVVAGVLLGSRFEHVAGAVSRPSAAVAVGPRSTPSASPAPFARAVLIADRGNGRLLVVDRSGRILWRFPVAGSLPKGQGFSADDAFFAPDGKTIVANDEEHDMIYRIDIATRKIVWSYGDYDVAGSKPGQLHTPDDAYPLPNGNISVADIFNCRILEISPSHSIVRQLGTPSTCRENPPASFAVPNGDTPLPDGGLLVTEITGSRVVRLDASGHVIWDIHVPVTYPSDAQLMPDGNVLVVDYSTPGAILIVRPTGEVVWRWGPPTGEGMLDHPSLAVPLPDGTILLNDDGRDRILQIDPRTDTIVWQYGVTDKASPKDGYLDTPDGLDPVPPGVTFP